LTWKIEFTPEAEKQLAKTDRQSAKRIINFLLERIATAEDPRSLGKALKGVLREFWRFRVGDYRIICRIEDDRLLVLVVRVAHRREAYRR
jgi:mRNA interferase RelE/StbE